MVFVPYVLPGEVARVEMETQKQDLWRGRVAEIVAGAPERVAAPCPVFTRCGGCQYQHAPYEFQVEQRKAIVREVMRRVGKFDAPEELGAVHGEPWEYRNRSQFHFANGEIGYLEAGSHRLCPVEQCPISSPKVNETLGVLRGMMADERFPTFVRSLEIFTNEVEVQLNVLDTPHPLARRFFDWCADMIPSLVPGHLDYLANGDLYRVSHRSFFQVNRFLTDRLVEVVLEGAEGGSALDLYAGVGLFSLPLARRFETVTAVESGTSPVSDLVHNAERAGLPVAAIRSATELFLPGIETAPDFVLADPPRAGMGKQVVRELLRLRPRQLVIVACDPSTLARDLAMLLGGGYRIDRMTVVDLFPHTAHIETVVHLS